MADQKPRGSLNAAQLESLRSTRSAAAKRGATGRRPSVGGRGVSARPGTARRGAAHPAKKAGKTGLFGRLAARVEAFVGKRRKPINRANLRVLALLWFFPVGIPLMWRRSCTWPRGVKIGISAVMAALLLALIMVPMPDNSRALGGVQLVSYEPEVEVYGPAIPATTMPAYTNSPGASIIVDAEAEDVHYVYAADGAECYHEYECKFAYASSHRLTVYEAYFLGYRPCGRCNPPVYTGQ